MLALFLPSFTAVAGLNDDDIHIAFSTDCGSYQNWQAEALAYSALMVLSFPPRMHHDENAA